MRPQGIVVLKFAIYYVFAGVAEGNPSLGVVLNEVGYCQTKYGEESLSDEDREELLQ